MRGKKPQAWGTQYDKRASFNFWALTRLWGMCKCHGMPVEVRGQPEELVRTPRCGFWELNTDCQAWQQLSFPAEPAHWPTKLINMPDIFWANFHAFL